MKKGTTVENTKTTTPEQQIENLIETIQKERRKGADAAFEQGKRFADLRELTASYEKDTKSGLSYHKSVLRTGYAWATAERLRNMYDTVTAAKIPADIYTVLADYGCDLAAKRTTTPAGIVHDLGDALSKLDLTSEQAIRVMVTKINGDYPLERKGKSLSTSLDTLAEVLTSIEQMPKSGQTEKMKKETQEAIVKTKKEMLLSLASVLAPFIGKDEKWAEGYVEAVADNPVLLDQRYQDAVKFAKSATFLTEGTADTSSEK